MLFNSLDFFLYFPIVLGLYWVLPLFGRQLLLLGASLYFYMYWNVPYVSLLIGSGVCDWFIARRLGHTENERARKALLAVSICVNLGILGFFKYYNFFLDSLDEVGARPAFLPMSNLLLPLGISFYTFQTMSYTIDVFRRRIVPEPNLLKVLLYVSFFPQLVAGPIERASSLMPQLEVKQRFDYDNLVEGGRRVLGGFIKKIVVADNIARVVDPVYAAPEEHSWFALLLATYAFAIQIFCDFSGYSDIAIGLARMMGYRFMENFDVPYVSKSIQEFWRRWHISLSSWLRDYLYISLGGNRKGTLMTYRNLLVTMLLGGLWHGASWNFVIWGALHGGWLSLERWFTGWRGERSAPARSGWSSRLAHSMGGALKMVLVFHGVCVTWVFFRAQTLGDSTAVLSRILTGAGGVQLPLYDTCHAAMIAVFGGLYFLVVRELRKRPTTSHVWQPAGAFGVLLAVIFGATSHDFIYFVF